mmetsp:Transcript_27704/g.56781  ORF Transcript_27704/g.56781 Transcript_27704/m.56781 type:complete len:90 (+) Transcript_27704:626-895(+)
MKGQGACQPFLIGMVLPLLGLVGFFQRAQLAGHWGNFCSKKQMTRTSMAAVLVRMDTVDLVANQRWLDQVARDGESLPVSVSTSVHSSE